MEKFLYIFLKNIYTSNKQRFLKLFANKSVDRFSINCLQKSDNDILCLLIVQGWIMWWVSGDSIWFF